MRSTRRTEESGAIAIISALLAVVIFGMAAFVVDFGIAYNSKRQLQTAADAGALAAAQVYKSQTGVPCATLLGNLTLKAQAQAAADKWAELNRPAKEGTAITLRLLREWTHGHRRHGRLTRQRCLPACWGRRG